jgi:hypothetical protein
MNKVFAVLGSLLLLSFGGASAQVAGPDLTAPHARVARSAPQALEPESTLIRIYDNFNHRNPDKAYGSGSWLVAAQQSLAMPFTPERNAIVKRIRVAVARLHGTDGVSLSLREDAGGGLPGAVIKRQMLWDLPDYYDCCEKMTAVFKPGVPVTAGTTYWVVLKVNKLTADQYGGWKYNWDLVEGPLAYTENGVWKAGWNEVSAFSVLGRWAEEGE